MIVSVRSNWRRCPSEHTTQNNVSYKSASCVHNAEVHGCAESSKSALHHGPPSDETSPFHKKKTRAFIEQKFSRIR